MESVWRLVWTETFRRTAKKWLRSRPWMKPTLSEVLHALERNPFDPSLRLHPLHGALEGKQAVRLSYSDRIVLTVERREKDIVLLDIGGHDEAYR